MRWCWWRCWWRLTPSRWEDRWWWRWWWFPPPGGMFRRQNCSAEALDWFRQGSTSWRRSFLPRRWLMIFSHRKTPYSRRWPSEGYQGAHEVVGRAPTLVGRVWPPGEVFALNIFYIFGKQHPWSFRTFGAVQNRSLIFAPFPARIPAAGILPLYVNLVK